MLAEADRARPLRDFGDLSTALGRLSLPVFAIARNGLIRWMNQAAEDVVGDRRGLRFTQVVAPESKGIVESAFASKVVGSRSSTDYEAVLLKEDGSPVRVEICSVAVDGKDGTIGVLGVFGVADRSTTLPRPQSQELTPRQAEVLAYLSRGYGTEDMAAAMSLSAETVRNHVRGLLQRLGVHSRLEAVMTGRERGLV
jgi:DNA-binding CsgD family transcriptional regulator